MTKKSNRSALKHQSNADRLLKHLKVGSLARQLVEAHQSAAGPDPMESARTVLLARLKHVRASLDRPET